LMRATLRQLDNKGSSLIRLDGGAYYQVEWSDVNLITVEHTKLKREHGYRYIGRLNEIYALEVQHNALNKLGRIGVPVKPGYGLVFGAIRLRIWGPKTEQVALAKSFDNRTVTAVLRPQPKGLVAILLSAEVKNWLADQLEQLQDTLPNEVREISTQLIGWIKADSDLRLLCKQVASGTLELGVTQEKQENGESKKTTTWKSKLSINFGGAAVFSNPVTPTQGPHLLLELDPIA